MVGKLVGAAAFLSLVAVIWLLVWRADWHPGALIGAAVLFLFIGGFATLDPSEWRKKSRP